ncbi:hypothetical protein FAI40_06965 [Acetobacteraceae bacterium]|nr:hypothetical protein FAI40_06965 [Acetobacteraceae bacterium]
MPDLASAMLIGELRVRAHVMTLGTGLYCLFLAKDQDFVFSKDFPAVKVARAPGAKAQDGNVTLVSFDNEGWLNEETPALLIRVKKGPAQILVSFYDEAHSQAPLPRLQLLPVGGNADEAEINPQKPILTEKDFKEGSLLAHIQERGDVIQDLSDWIGDPDSEKWIEGFKINVPPSLKPEDLEYQAVLGKGWLSPWVEGGEFCGSRGMSLPLLGLKVRLKEEASKKWDIHVEAAFTDGFSMDNLTDSTLALESPEHSPLEAFRISFVEKGQKKPAKKATSRKKKKE